MKMQPGHLRFWLICLAPGYRYFLLLFLFGLLLSCTNYSPPILPQSVPQQWAHELPVIPEAPKPDLQSWWKTFGDAKLNQLVEQALITNLDLTQARERIIRTRALLRHKDDEFLPELHFHARTIESIDALDTYFQYGFDATWELGWFGRHDATNRIAQANADTVMAGAQAMQVSVIAEIVRTYIELRSSQQQIIALNTQYKLAQSRAELFALRNHLQLSTTQEVTLAQHEVTQVQTALLKHQQFVDEAAQRLALLLGQQTPDSSWLIADTQPQFAEITLTNFPADLLRTRPELQVAEAAVLHASGELGIAKSELYPHISLGSAFLYSANITRNDDLDDAVHSTPGIGPNIDIPLFDWGRRQAAVHTQNSVLDESLMAYQQAVLEAVNESEIALSSLELQQKLLAIAKNNVVIQQQTLVREQKLMRSGLSSQLTISEIEQTKVQVDLDLIEAHASHDLAFIALYKALGGAPFISVPSSANLVGSNTP